MARRSTRSLSSRMGAPFAARRAHPRRRNKRSDPAIDQSPAVSPFSLAGEGWGEGKLGKPLRTDRATPNFPYPRYARPLPHAGAAKGSTLATVGLRQPGMPHVLAAYQIQDILAEILAAVANAFER